MLQNVHYTKTIHRKTSNGLHMVVSTVKQNNGIYVVTFDLGRFQQQNRRMLVTGSFCDWITELPTTSRNGFVRMKKKENHVSFLLHTGCYEYKYYDMAGQEWMEIERFPEIYYGYHWDYVKNPFGTLNCLLHLS